MVIHGIIRRGDGCRHAAGLRRVQVSVVETTDVRALSTPELLYEVIEKYQVAGERFSTTQRMVPGLLMTMVWLKEVEDWP